MGNCYSYVLFERHAAIEQQSGMLVSLPVIDLLTASCGWSAAMKTHHLDSKKHQNSRPFPPFLKGYSRAARTSTSLHSAIEASSRRSRDKILQRLTSVAPWVREKGRGRHRANSVLGRGYEMYERLYRSRDRL